MILKTVGVLVSLTILSLTLGSVQAASFDMEVKLFQDVTTCPTIMEGTPPLNKDDIPIFINNFYQYPDTFHLSLELPAGWQGFVEPDFVVDAGHKRQIDPIWITVPDVEPGTYEVGIKARSGQTGQEMRKTFKVRVLSCHHVQLDAVEPYKEICREEPEKASVQIRIANKGASAEAFSLSVYQGGLPISWAAGIPSINVPAGEQVLVNFTLSPPTNLAGEQRFNIVAKSTTSYAEGSVEIRMLFKDCYAFTAELQAAQVSVCSEEKGTFMVTITNTGKVDTFEIAAPYWIEAAKNVSLAEKEKRELKVLASKPEKGLHSFDIKVTSLKDKEDVKTLSGTLNVQECRGLAIVVTPENQSVCAGQKALFKVMVKNTGSIAEDIELAANMGVLEATRVGIEAKGVKVLDLVVDTKNFTGKKTLTVAAKSGIIIDSASTEVVSENCYAASLDVSPSSVKLCPCDKAEVTLTVRNAGKLNDTYTVALGNATTAVAVASGMEEVVKMPVEAMCAANQSFNMTASVKSAYVSVEGQILVDVEKPEECYGLLIYDGKYIEVQPKKSFAMPVRVKNVGKKADTFYFTLQGPSWTYMEPVQLRLEPGQNGSTFLYISPPFNVVKGVHEATVRVKSAYAEGFHKVLINVTEGLPTKPVTEEPANVTNVTEEGGNVTLEPGKGEGVVLNASVNESELPTARVIQLEKTTRLIIVAVIVIAVVLILIVRFMTLVK